jgi:class 3 adenylate cyclase
VQRKTVTVLFCDVTGSTALGESVDPEALRALLARYFERMKAIVERHGGTVEKFIGDAVMAVFGVPVAHEDDALRAVRAAAEMREALPELGVHARIGVNTGEVVTGTEERLATGDAVNVAARLEQAAAPDEVLIGGATLALVRGAAEVAAVEPFELKGKTEPVAAYRLLRVTEAPERSHGSRFVGRARELAKLRESWARANGESRCELVTIVGDAGVGKSRLVGELLHELDARAVRGRCLPYGEGITYWPVVEVVKQLRVVPEDPAAAAALRSLLGESEDSGSAEEIAWAVRKTLEQGARARPLAVVLDDIQWGEETFLDLVEHVALLSTGAPMLLVCLARPELMERRPAWPVALRLGPLDGPEVEELMPERIGAELRERIARAAGGNPLFLTEMLAMTDETNGDVVVPPTLQALLAARLDQLDPAERIVLECGAVEGEIFHRGAVQALAPEEAVTPRLAALVRRELIRPDRALLPGDDGFRFHHLLIRDAAYDSIPKATRAELHERFATWLEQHAAALVELDELVGYHLEQALRYKRELGQDDPALAGAARRVLGAAGRRALEREDAAAAVNLLGRAAGLLASGEFELEVELDLVLALGYRGEESEAAGHAASMAERAMAAGDRVVAACGRILEAYHRANLEPEGGIAALAALVEEALPVLGASGDDLALWVAYFVLANIERDRVRLGAMRAASEQSLVHARRLGDALLELYSLGYLTAAHHMGPTPASELLGWLDELESEGFRQSFIVRTRAEALAMLGRLDEARPILTGLQQEFAERGAFLAFVRILEARCEVELWAGEAAAAERLAEERCRGLEQRGERGSLSTAVAMRAQALYELDRLAEAEAESDRAGPLGASDDVATQMLSRQVKAKVLARRGHLAEGEAVAREAVALAEETDMLESQGWAWADLAEVLSLAERTQEAAAALEEALARYERKGNVLISERMRVRLADLRH